MISHNLSFTKQGKTRKFFRLFHFYIFILDIVSPCHVFKYINIVKTLVIKVINQCISYQLVHQCHCKWPRKQDFIWSCVKSKQYTYVRHILLFYIDRYGRKKSTIWGLVISSLALIIAVFIPYQQTRKGSIFNSIDYLS